jgi:hypothetical protein
LTRAKPKGSSENLEYLVPAQPQNTRKATKESRASPSSMWSGKVMESWSWVFAIKKALANTPEKLQWKIRSGKS